MTTVQRETQQDQSHDHALAIQQDIQKAKGYTQARCVCGYTVPLTQYLYSGNDCPGILADGWPCDGTLVLVK